MNIREKVRFCVDDAMNTATGYAQGQESVESERAALERATDRIISLVRAARDAEIREQAMTRKIAEAGAKCHYRSEGGLLSDCEFDALPETRRRMLTEAAAEVIFGAMTAILGPRPQEQTNDHE